MEVSFCTAGGFITTMREVPVADFTQSRNHTGTASNAVVSVSFIPLKIGLLYGYETPLLIKSIVVFDSSHSNLLLLVGNEVQVGIEDYGDSGKDIDTSGVFALLNTGQISRINTG